MGFADRRRDLQPLEACIRNRRFHSSGARAAEGSLAPLPGPPAGSSTLGRARPHHALVAAPRSMTVPRHLLPENGARRKPRGQIVGSWLWLQSDGFEVRA